MAEITKISINCFCTPVPVSGILARGIEHSQVLTFETGRHQAFLTLKLASEDPNCIDAPNHEINLRKTDLVKILKFLTEDNG